MSRTIRGGIGEMAIRSFTHIGRSIVVEDRFAGNRRELSAGVRKSEAVALCHPIMPVGDGFGGRVVRINSRQL